MAVRYTLDPLSYNRIVMRIPRIIQETIVHISEEMLQSMMEQIAVAIQNDQVDPKGKGSKHGNYNRNGELVVLAAVRREERMQQLEVLYFTGNYPHGWLYSVGRYCEINQIPEEKVATAVVSLEARALNWFQWWEPRMRVMSWSAFCWELLRKFRFASSDDQKRSRSVVESGNFPMVGVMNLLHLGDGQGQEDERYDNGYGWKVRFCITPPP